MSHPETFGDIGRPRLAGRCYEIRDQFNVILHNADRPRFASLAKATRLRRLFRHGRLRLIIGGWCHVRSLTAAAQGSS